LKLPIKIFYELNFNEKDIKYKEKTNIKAKSRFFVGVDSGHRLFDNMEELFPF